MLVGDHNRLGHGNRLTNAEITVHGGSIVPLRWCEAYIIELDLQNDFFERTGLGQSVGFPVGILASIAKEIRTLDNFQSSLGDEIP